MIKTHLTFAALRHANVLRLPLFKNGKGEPAHSTPDGSDWSLGDWMTALLGELGEAANVIKKVRRGDVALALVRDDLANEFADVIVYADITAFRLGMPALMVIDDIPNFAALRNHSITRELHKAPALGDIMTAAFAGFGAVAYCVNNKRTNGSGIVAGFNQGVASIAAASATIGIDLGDAVAEKFNIVSKRVGVDIFINASNEVVNWNGDKL